MKISVGQVYKYFIFSVGSDDSEAGGDSDPGNAKEEEEESDNESDSVNESDERNEFTTSNLKHEQTAVQPKEKSHTLQVKKIHIKFFLTED